MAMQHAVEARRVPRLHRHGVGPGEDAPGGSEVAQDGVRVLTSLVVVAARRQAVALHLVVQCRLVGHEHLFLGALAAASPEEPRGAYQRHVHQQHAAVHVVGAQPMLAEEPMAVIVEHAHHLHVVDGLIIELVGAVVAKHIVVEIHNAVGQPFDTVGPQAQHTVGCEARAEVGRGQLLLILLREVHQRHRAF